jgi:hypothetical protein
MKTLTPLRQEALFREQTDSGAKNHAPLVLQAHGKIPSFKNQKMIIPPSAKMLKQALDSGDMAWARTELQNFLSKRPALITKPERQKRMEEIINGFVSQLRLVLQTSEEQTSPESSIRSWIASSVPADDCWAMIPDIVIRGELCEPGQEGATITIERFD